jgi:hypothetical protein
VWPAWASDIEDTKLFERAKCLTGKMVKPVNKLYGGYGLGYE